MSVAWQTISPRNISASELDNTGPVTGEEQDRDTTPGSIFTDLGFRYTGPVDGHDINVLLENLDALKAHSGPKLLHLITKKGKGYAPAETSPVSSHSLTKLEKQSENRGDHLLCGIWRMDHQESSNGQPFVRDHTSNEGRVRVNPVF